MKILLTCSNDHPGVRTHLLELKDVLFDRAKFRPIETFISVFPDYRKIKRRRSFAGRVLKKISRISISKEIIAGTSDIIIGSWKPYYGKVIETLNGWGILPSILWCSTLGQTEMTWTVELEAFATILEFLRKGKVRYLFVPERTFESISHIQNVVYLPHPIVLTALRTFQRGKELDGNNIDLFMKARPGKNVLHQMVAQKFANTDYILHTNIRNPEILTIAKKLKLSFAHYGWLPENEYYSLIGSMDLSLQVSWTESFNYAVCERFLLGVPVLVSNEIFWVARDRLLKKHLVVEDIDSAKAIAERIDALLEDRDLRVEIAARGKEVVESIAEKYNKEILQQIKSCY